MSTNNTPPATHGSHRRRWASGRAFTPGGSGGTGGDEGSEVEALGGEAGMKKQNGSWDRESSNREP